MNDEEKEKAERTKRINELIESIKSKRQDTSKKVTKGNMVPYTRSGRGRGRRSEYKEYLGWQHYTKNAFRVVTNAKGGGTRTITCKADQDITVVEIIETGKKLFFKGGHSYFGDLETMSVCLIDPRGQMVTQFTDLNGEPCTYTDYLKAYGMYPSQCHLYLRTKLEQTKHEAICEVDLSGKQALQTQAKNSFFVNNQQVGTINVVYGKIKQSLYSSATSTVRCNSYQTCVSMCYEQHEDEQADLNIFDNGFTVMCISKSDKTYLLETENEYIFSQAANSDTIIIHGPDTIHGLEADNSEHLLLAVLTTNHNQGCEYRWYKDNNIVDSGHNHCLLRTNEVGKYWVEIDCYEGITVRSDEVSILFTLEPQVNVLSTACVNQKVAKLDAFQGETQSIEMEYQSTTLLHHRWKKLYTHNSKRAFSQHMCMN